MLDVAGDVGTVEAGAGVFAIPKLSGAVFGQRGSGKSFFALPKVSPRVWISGATSRCLYAESPVDTGRSADWIVAFDEDSEVTTIDGEELARYFRALSGSKPLVVSVRLKDFVLDITDAGAESLLLPLDEIASGLRDRVALPVQDIAKMCGVERRQFYNLLDGKTKKPQQEPHIRLLFESINDLADQLNGDEEQVRIAVLTPLEELGLDSFYDVATRLDTDRLRDARAALLAHLASGRRLTDSPAPSANFRPGDPRWEEADDFLRGYDSTAGE